MQQIQCQRPSVKFIPKWPGPIRAWAVNYCKKNLWKVEPEMDFDDLISDAMECFIRVRDHYPEVVDPPHFFALYRTTLFNHVTRLATQRTKNRQRLPTCQISVLSKGERKTVLNNITRNCDGSARRSESQQGIEDVDFRMLLEDAPDNVVALVQKILEAEELPRMERHGRVRETTNSYLCRLINADPKTTNLHDVVKRWIYGERQLV